MFLSHQIRRKTRTYFKEIPVFRKTAVNKKKKVGKVPGDNKETETTLSLTPEKDKLKREYQNF